MTTDWTSENKQYLVDVVLKVLYESTTNDTDIDIDHTDLIEILKLAIVKLKNS
jgi:hypothetical protein